MDPIKTTYKLGSASLGDLTPAPKILDRQRHGVD
jgi:hypothetical protein